MEHPDADSGVAALAVGSLIDRRHVPFPPSAERRPALPSDPTKLWIQYSLTSLDLAKICVNTLKTNIRRN